MDKISLLIVSDNLKKVKYLETDLHERFKDFSIEYILSPFKAFDILEKKAFGIILVSHEIEGLSGFEFINQLRKTGNVTPAILIAKKKTIDILQKAYLLGLAVIGCNEDHLDILSLELAHEIRKILTLSNEIQQRFQDTKTIEDAYIEQTEELEKRLWELTFLFSIPGILNGLNENENRSFNEVIDLIHKTWQWGNNLSIEIRYKENVYTSKSVITTKLNSISSIEVFGEEIGKIVISYPLENTTYSENYFLQEALTREIAKVTERISASQQLSLERDKYQMLVEKLVDGVILEDLNGLITFTNPSILNLLGYSENELIEKSCTIIFENSEIYNRLIELIITSGSSRTFESSIISKVGELIPVRITMIPIFDNITYKGILNVITDLREKKEAEKAKQLREAKTRIEAIINNIADGVLVLDKSGDLFLTNRSFKKMFYKIFNHSNLCKNWISNPENIFTETIYHLFSSDSVKQQTIEPLSHYHLQLTSTKLSTSGLEGFIIITIHDISPYIEFDKMVKQFISTASHELRTPTSVIVQSLNNLKKYEDKISDELKVKLMDSLYRNATLMYELVDDLLFISRIDEKRIKLSYELFKIYDIIDGIVNQLEPKKKEKNISILNLVGSDLVIFGDEKRISQVFRILLDNAIKYSNDNKSINITATKNYMGKYNPHGYQGVLICFSDEGIGIKEKDLPFIFDRFYRSPEVRGNYIGTGLGLAIAKDLVNLHNGEIYIESELTIGSRFFIFLPNKNDRGN